MSGVEDGLDWLGRDGVTSSSEWNGVAESDVLQLGWLCVWHWNPHYLGDDCDNNSTDRGIVLNSPKMGTLRSTMHLLCLLSELLRPLLPLWLHHPELLFCRCRKGDENACNVVLGNTHVSLLMPCC